MLMLFEIEINLPFQRLHCLPRHFLPHAEYLYPNLLNLLQFTNLPDMWDSRLTGPELASSNCLPATLGVLARSGVRTGAGREDSVFHTLGVVYRNEEDELEFGGHGCLEFQA